MYPSLKAYSTDRLLSLRLALDCAQPYLDLDQDIQDLYTYPERLRFSYPDEWRVFIRQQLIKRGITDEAMQQSLRVWDERLSGADIHAETFQSNDNIDAKQNVLSDEADMLYKLLEKTEQRLKAYQDVIADVKNIESAPNVSSLSSPLQRSLKKIIE